MIRIGTSGWVYQDWKGVLYPDDLPQRLWLERYAENFGTVEINASFYHLPKRATFEGWRRRTPPGFVFAVKANRYITHRLKLADVEEPWQRFLEAARGLGRKLGVALLQFPPRWHADPQRLAAFLRLVPRGLRCAFEFRDPSWFCDEIYALLRKRGAALCRSSSPSFPDADVVTAPFFYVRFHGGSSLYSSNYSDQELAVWAEALKAYRAQGLDAYAYFNNDVSGYAVRNARRLRELVGEG